MAMVAQQADLVTITSADGTPIALWKTGTGSSLLVVHGTAADHTAWDKVVPLLADSFTVYAMDRRGRGASGDGPEYSLEREIDDVVSAMATIPGPVHLYGHSFGGYAAAHAALRSGDLGRLVLYEGGPKPAGFPRFSSEEFLVRLERLIAAGHRDEAIRTFMLNAAGVTPEELPVLQAHTAWAGRVAAAHTIPRELRALDEAPGSDLGRFASITAPTLVVVGSETLPERQKFATLLTQVVPNARVAVLPGQRHAAHNTAPELLASALKEFLTSP